MKRLTLVLILACMTSTSATLLAKDNHKVYDAVIIPGFPFNPDGKMNAVYRMRLAWALELYETGRTQHIILSGGAVHSPYVEAEIFALYLMEKGIPAEALILERNAEHSMENVFYSMEIAKKYGFEEVAVATDMFQSGMIQFIGKIEGHDLTDVDFLPAKMSIVNRYWKSFELDIDYDLAYREDFIPLIERKNKEERKKGTHGLTWKPSELVELSYATEIK